MTPRTGAPELPEVAAPNAQDPQWAEPPRRRLWQNLTDKAEGFTVPYEQFEQDVCNDKKRGRLYDNLRSGCLSGPLAEI